MTKEKIAALVAAAQKGDAQAFNDLYNATAPDLKIIGYSILHKHEDVEDALQETYITIYRSFSGQGISPIKNQESFLPWAKQIMKNSCLNLLAMHKRKMGQDELRPMNSEEDKEGMDTIDNPDDDLDFSPEDAVEANYVRSLIEEAMADIPAIRQTCLALHQQGLTYSEIGQQLNIPEGTAKSHVRYARIQLQKVVRKIEKEENVEVNGILFVPTALGMKLFLRITPKKKSWISAELKTDTAKKAAHIKSVTFANIGRRAMAVLMSMVLMTAVGMGPSKSPNNTDSSPNVLPTPIEAEAKVETKDNNNNENREIDVKDLNYKPNSDYVKQGSTGEDNEYYEPNAVFAYDDVEIVPFHLWFQGGKLYADCYVVNSTTDVARNINLEELKITNKKGTIAQYPFGKLQGISLNPQEYTTHLFVFPNNVVKSKNLENDFGYSSKVTWENTRGKRESSGLTFTSNKRSQKLMGKAATKNDNLVGSVQNAYNNPNFKFVGSDFQFTPHDPRIEGDQLHVTFRIKNETEYDVSNLNIGNLEIWNEDGTVAEYNFGFVPKIKLGPNEEKDYELIFPAGTFKSDADFTKKLYCHSDTTKEFQ